MRWFMIGVALVYLAVSTPLTVWMVDASLPKIRAQFGRINWFVFVPVTVLVWLTAPAAFVLYLRKRAKLR